MRGTEMTLPSGSIGRNGFLLPENSAATNAAPAKGQPVLARGDDFQFKPDGADTNFNIASFSGNVQVKSEKGNLSCELMTIRSTAQSNRTESVVAERSVVMEQGNNRVTGAKAVYTATNEMVEVTGKPSWKLSQREGTAEVLAFDLKSRAYQATRDVRMRLPPGGLGASTWLARGVVARTNTTAGVTSTNQPAPVEVAAEYFELKPDAVNTNLSEAVYRGHVQVSEAERMNLTCDSLSLTGKMMSGTNQVERVVCEGGVDLVVREPDGERRAQGDRAVYTAINGEVVLTAGSAVKFVVTDAKGVIEGSGSKAVYASAKEVLELTGNNPMLTADAGKVWGDTVILDRANTTLKATGNWKMKLNPDVLRQKVKPAPKKAAP
jgi:lipopolysaccharide export system protein LptA